MKKHLAIFVTDGSELIGIQKDTKPQEGDKEGFCWETFCWFNDHYFMSIINQVLENASPAKVVFGSKQIPKRWVGARHFVLSFERFMLMISNILDSSPPLDDLVDNQEFKCFYEWTLVESFKRLRELQDDVKGIYKMVPDNLFVILAIRPVKPHETSLDFLHKTWADIIPNVGELLQEIFKEIQDKRDQEISDQK